MRTDLSTYSGPCIYTIWDDSRPNKFYIGKTINYASRAKRHALDLSRKRHGNTYLQRLFDKGAQLNICPLEICDKESLSNREVFWVSFYKSNDTGYNLSKGGEAMPDELLKWSEERKKAWSKRCSNNPIAAGTKKSAEWKVKMQQSIKRRKASGTFMAHKNVSCVVLDKMNKRNVYKSIKEAAQISGVAYTYLTEKLKAGSGKAIIKSLTFSING